MIKLKNTSLINIKGKNIYTYLKYLLKEKIEILKCEYINIHEINILIDNKDLEKLLNLKTSYSTKIIKTNGLKYIKYKLNQNKHFIILFILSYIFLIYLMNIITKVEVIHEDKAVRELLINTLEKYDIKKGFKKKSYKEIEKIKENIIKDNKEKIEWIEIIEQGTKYIVKVEERIINEDKKDNENYNIVSTKNAIVKEISAEKGEVIVTKEQYVRKGDILIRGDIYLNETKKDTVSAKGRVYGEVWYKVTVEYPKYYEEKKDSNDTKEVYTLTILNKKIELTKDKYKVKRVKEKTLLKSNLLPIKLSKEHQTKQEIIKKTYTKNEAINNAIKEIDTKITSTLKEKEHIIDIKKLKVEENNSKIILEAFVSVYEEIGIKENIKEIEE